MNLYSFVKDHHADGCGLYSVCSAHPGVLETAVRHAAQHGITLVVEATANQVDQFGGYTGMTPAQFRDMVLALAKANGLAPEQLVLGGDHLGPLSWHAEPAAAAMDKAEALVRAYAAAGFAKIHLDCSMACADDTGPVPLPEDAAGRAARLCRAAEESARAAGHAAPVYVIGTEVPIPGGATHDLGDGVPATRPEDARATLHTHREAFLAQGLDEAWERVIGLVVQPGVEFDHAAVADYRPEAAASLVKLIQEPGMPVYEAHSTDYQRPESLQALVRDHFAILKVGPWLTWAWRQGLFALESMERELLAPDACSGLSATLEQVMLADPRYWQAHYKGSEAEQRLARRHSFSDRVRYYWPNPALREAEQRLLRNLNGIIPLPLLAQYMPLQYEDVRAGRLPNTPLELVRAAVTSVLNAYAAACAGNHPSPKGL